MEMVDVLLVARGKIWKTTLKASTGSTGAVAWLAGIRLLDRH